MADKLWTVGQAAEMIGVDRSTVNRWIKSGKLKAFKIWGGNHRIKDRDLYVFMQQYDISSCSRDDSPIRILIIEDDEHVREILRLGMGRNPNYSITATDCWFEGGFLIHENKPDVLIMDIILGNVDARDIIEVLKGWPECCHMKIIGISGRIDTDKYKMLELGFDAYFQKPVDLDELHQMVHQLLNGITGRRLKRDA